LLLFEQQIFAALALDRGHVALREKLLRGRHQPLGKLNALSLQFDLSAQIADFGLRAGDEHRQPLALGGGAALLCRDLMLQHVVLPAQGGQLCRVEVLPISRDLVGRDRKKRVAAPYLLTLLHVQVRHHPLAAWEHLQGSRRRGQKAGHGLLPGELRQAEEDDRDSDNGGKQPRQQFGRDRLQERDIAEFALPALKLNRLLTKKLSGAHRCHRQKPRSQVYGSAVRKQFSP